MLMLSQAIEMLIIIGLKASVDVKQIAPDIGIVSGRKR